MALSPLSVSKFRLLFAGGWLLWTAVQVKVLYWYRFPLFLAVMDSLVSNFLLAGACLIIINLFHYYLPASRRYSYVFTLATVLAILWLFTSRSILMILTYNISDYKYFFSQSVPVRLVISFLVIGSMALLSVLWYTVQDQKEAEYRRADAERLAKEAELYKLRQQLQPHFLFNSLNSINALIGLKPQEARTMIQQLSDFLRGTLKKEDNTWVHLEEELEHLQLYLEIEKVRFGHRLTTVIENKEAGNNRKIPAMLLQPIVENAIKFGLYDTLDDITISINTTSENKVLIITVQNPFDPSTSVPKQGTGFGLNSVQRRLYLLFARNDLLQTESKDTMFTTTVKIPQQE